MKRTKVNSSVISAIGYEENSRMLEVEIKTGEVYQYLNVPASEFIGFINADSKGRYYYYLVIKKKYDYTRVAA